MFGQKYCLKWNKLYRKLFHLKKEIKNANLKVYVHAIRNQRMKC